ncbi:chaperonin family protein RbcX [Gloeocapsopsis sp. IPPAS B-1203]|uniref:RuBisCO chaperone RbcX n=1 Tax=Gloeocapsopsis sp. IPPAS B-1203 TaxID=2049454 RepID=UPI000C18F0D8|nr:chaperonin family protein RbcX [Gloeocapsopsis sp. IPPAS B-1203]PIG92660.1 chaperonin family protein RbcX [Gloeocapsopsis sp. IPPAS B-1203]
MDLKKIAKDTAKTLSSYLTYQAMRTVLAQISETNPPLAFWLHRFSSQEVIQDGEAYINKLFQEKPDLALRIMVVREHIAQEVVDFLPEMVLLDIQQANMEHRRQHLERITQLESNPSYEEQATTETNLDNPSN